MLLSSSAVSADWVNIREAVLRRDNYKCVECGTPCRSAEADVHHLLPRSAGGPDEPSNLVTLCDGCHAAHHPKLAGRLARRVMEKWAVRLALWLDRRRAISDATRNFGAALRLFGLERFRDGQLPVVEAALCGQSVLVVSPTGFGKSLCFQLPAILRPGVSVVVSPLKALMGEQVSALLRHKIPSTFINSDLDSVEKRIRYELLANKSLKLLYAAPERFFVQNKSELQMLQSLRPSFLVIDEAHCVDQWGRDFRPEYGRLNEIREALGSPPVLAFTATAGQEMQKRILASLGVNDVRVFVRGVDRPNISLLRWEVLPNERLETIAKLCRIPIPGGGKVMIFVPTRNIGETLQGYLRDQGLETPFYHAKLGSAWEREQLLKRFVSESLPLVNRIICTSAFGMGLDVPNVRLVIHYQHPSSVEDYFQEFGRAGRDGQPSVAVLLHADFGATKDKDIGLLQFMAKGASNGAQLDAANQTAALAHKYRQIDDMAGLVRQEGCFRQTLIGYFEGSEKGSRRSFSTRLLEWVFAESATPEKEIVCCDACCRDVIKRWGEIGYVSKVFGLRLGPEHEAGHRQSETGHRQSAIGISAFMGGAAILAILAIVMLPVHFQGKSTDAAKPQAVANSSVHADRTAVVAPLPGTNKSNTPPGDIMVAQNRLIELGFLAGPSDGVWGTKSRMALRAFKIANALAADDKWDDLVSSRLYSIQAARSPHPLATTGR
ncbi:MAG: RecQ family ATP-dependent DNA helicase [Alphaproteobacteria bacterium]|nr:MAG: RecQ family ATP-dependent DNA helicase [Alphaproteobacteria bacterium]